MECKNHPETNANDRYAECGASFCPNCLVEMDGVKYCGDCKVLALRGRPIQIEAAMTPCGKANSALVLAIVGVFVLAIILEPIALAKAFTAKSMIADNPCLTGGGKANAAILIAIASFCLWLLWIMVHLATHIQSITR